MAGSIEVKIKKLDGLTLAGIGKSGHWTVMDTSPNVGGSAGATTPYELLYYALGGCQSMDVLSVLAKKRNRVDKYELNITAERAEGYPSITPVINMEFLFWGDVKAADVERAIELSTDKYCGVSASIRYDIEDIRTYKINRE